MIEVPVMNDPGDRLFYRGNVHSLQLRPYLRGDEAKVEARADFAAAYEAEGRKLPEGLKWTVLDGRRTLAVAGLEALDGGTLGVWCYAADLSPRAWRFAGLCASAVIAMCRRRWGAAVAVQAMAEPIPGAAELLERIGFEPAAGSFSMFRFKETT